jgi:hypothetical protein
VNNEYKNNQGDSTIMNLTRSCAPGRYLRTTLKRCLGLLVLFGTLTLTACGVSPETQAKINEYRRTVPSCSSQAECQTKWARARDWAVQNADYPIYSESETRIRASSTMTTTSGTGIVVTREGSGNQWRFFVDIECFSAGGCGDVWDTRLDFNRVVNGG